MAIKPIVGNIPENVTYIYSTEKVLSSYWEDDALRAGFVGQSVTPAFCSDASNPKTLETGRNWAGTEHWVGNNRIKSKVNEFTRKNDPIAGIKIVSLEIRSEGGRAYKVITPDNYYFDVREDVLMDAMIEVGVSKGGIMNGEYIWAKVGSAMKLVRIGSVLHNALVAATADRVLKKLKHGDLKVGHIYKGKGAKSYVFLGYVDTEKFTCENVVNHTYAGKFKDNKYSRKEIKNGVLLMENSKYIIEQFLKDDLSPYGLEINNSHSFIKDIGEVQLPSNVINKINMMNIAHYEKSIGDSKKYSGFDNQRLIGGFAYYGEFIVVRETGSVYEAPEKFANIINVYNLI